jgi:hypothetical protein
VVARGPQRRHQTGVILEFLYVALGDVAARLVLGRLPFRRSEVGLALVEHGSRREDNGVLPRADLQIFAPSDAELAAHFSSQRDLAVASNPYQSLTRVGTHPKSYLSTTMIWVPLESINRPSRK